MRLLRSNSFERWAIACGWVAAAVLIALWLAATPNAELHGQLRRWQFWCLEAQFLLLGLLSWINLPRFVRSLELRGKEYAWAAAASLLALVLATAVAPRTNRIFYDEHIYQGVAQNLTDLRLAQMCNDGNAEYGSLQCWRGEYDKHPSGYPYLLSVLYRLVGVRESVAFALNTTVVALMALVVFLTTAALTGRPLAGGYAALIVALIPEQLRWSHSAAAEPSSALVCAFAVLTAVAFVRGRSTGALLWMVVATAFALQFRPECALIVPVVVLIVLSYAPEELTRHRFWWCGLLGFALLVFHVGHAIAVGNDSWGAPGDRISLDFLLGNLRANGLFYVWDGRFPAVYSALALCGLLLHRPRRAVLMPLAYFLLFWGVFLLFYAGSYNYGVNVRFSLLTYPPLAILAGIGAAALVERLATIRLPASIPPVNVARVMTVTLVVQFCWYLPLVRATGEEAWAARADVAFARVAAAALPENSIVLTHNPSMFHLWGRSAAQLSLATTESGYVERGLAPRYAGGVFLHWNFWCNVSDPMQQAFCTAALDRFPHTLVREYRERDFRYAIYRLDLPLEKASR